MRLTRLHFFGLTGLRIPRDVEEEDAQKPIQEVCGKLETCYTENY